MPKPVLTDQIWLVKQEPTGPKGYPFERFQQEGTTAWTGVRNFQARANLRAMRVGDLVFYYHSNEGKAIVGTAIVAREAYPDPTATEGDWVCVDLRVGEALHQPVTLATLRAHPLLGQMQLVRQSRLSVMPVTAPEATAIFALAT